MSMSYATNKLRVPPGFEHLLEGLAREILREQPKNLLEFAAQYFRNKLQERDGEYGFWHEARLWFYHQKELFEIYPNIGPTISSS